MLGEKVTEAIRKRLRDHEQILLGGAGLFDAVEQVSREQWRLYVERLALAERYPGIRASASPRPSVLLSEPPMWRASAPRALPITTSTQLASAGAVHLDHLSGTVQRRNLAAFGYDMYAEPIRQQAMQRAAQLGETSITGKVTLVQRPMARSRPGCCSMCPCIVAPADKHAGRAHAGAARLRLQPLSGRRPDARYPPRRRPAAGAAHLRQRRRGARASAARLA